MAGPKLTISIESDHLVVERLPGYEVTLNEQPAELAKIAAACEQASCQKVLILGPRTNVDLSAFDILELGKEIAKLGLKFAVVEDHDASADSVSLLETVTSNRGGCVQFFDRIEAAKDWLEIE